MASLLRSTTNSLFHQHPTEINNNDTTQQNNEDSFEVDEILLMHMEREWGMKEMARYKEAKGSWPLKSELPGYNDSDTTETATTTTTETETSSSSSSSKTSNIRGRQRHIFSDIEDEQEKSIMFDLWSFLPTQI